MHLRQDAETPGKLTQWKYSERCLGEDGPRDGELPVLCQHVIVLAHARNVSLARGSRQPVLVYHVFWGADAAEPHSIRRLFARFVRFGMESVLVPAGDAARARGVA